MEIIIGTLIWMGILGFGFLLVRYNEERERDDKRD
jgi:hypothetical protein